MLVGETGLEPAASWSQTMRATKLRHSPTHTSLYEISAGMPNGSAGQRIDSSAGFSLVEGIKPAISGYLPSLHDRG
jgi:hypothetical protein